MVGLEEGRFIVWGGVPLCVFVPHPKYAPKPVNADMEDIQVRGYGVALHPKGWTLRDTAVKRFRRSDDDFRLDISELILPPFVMEMVCGETDQVMKKRGNECFCS